MTTPTTQADRRATALDVMAKLRAGRVDNAQAGAENTERTWGAIGSFACDFTMGELWSRPDLSRRDRSMVVLAALVTLGGQPMEVRVHTRGALNHGMTREEVEEVLVHLSAYAGFPRAIGSFREVQEVFKALDGGKKQPAHEPAERKDDAQRRRDGLDVARTLRDLASGAEAESAYMEGLDQRFGRFAPLALNYLLGEVWARPQLTRRDRSIVSMTSLAVQGRMEELRIHVEGALNHGVTRDEIEEVFGQLLGYAGWPTGYAALRTARAAFDELDAATGKGS